MVAVLLTIAGCASDNTYQFNNLYSEDVQTVAVPIFENKTFYTGVEREITDALIKEIQARTPYRISETGSADSIITGEITQVSKDPLNARRGTGLVQEVALSITVDFEWTDQYTGRKLVVRKDFRSGEVYIPAQPVGEHSDIGIFAVAQEMARDIVSTMQDEW